MHVSNDSSVSLLEKIDCHIQEFVSPQQYRTWFQTLKIVDVTDEEIVLSVSNDFLREWICHYYVDVMGKVIGRVVGDSKKFTIVSESNSSEPRDTREVPLSCPATVQAPTDAARGEGASSAVHEPAPKTMNPRTAAGGNEVGQSLANPFSNLNFKYLFDKFIVGRSNELAYAASLAVADAPARSYNPLFIHGSVGLGKTHLLQAICHRRLQTHPDTKVLYLSCETFINQFISAIEKGNIHHFRNKYRHIDILLIDDIYLIANKERTQEEFFHTFNSLYNAGKQIVLSSDSPPSEIPTLEDRLVSRFKWGLVVQIESPNFETRYAILRAKARAMGHEVPDDVLTFLAENVDTNIRELEGAITKVIGFSVLTKAPLDCSLAKLAMRDVIKKPITYITIDDIVRAVTKKCNVKLSDLQSRKRNHSITLPRQICMYIAKKKTALSLQEIGGFFGGRDHTTVIYAYDKINKEISKNEAITNIVNDILSQLGD